MAKFGTQKKVTVGGVEYTLQHPGVKRAIDIVDETVRDNGNPKVTALYENYMKDVIVDPKTDWDYWEENEGLQEVMNEVSTFLNN